MLRYDWPLNVRELEQCLVTSSVLAHEGLVTLEDLGPAALDVKLPEHWRVYGDRGVVDALVSGGFSATLARAGRRDLVIELLDSLVIVYPAASDVVGTDAFADLTTTALEIVMSSSSMIHSEVSRVSTAPASCSRRRPGASPRARTGPGHAPTSVETSCCSTTETVTAPRRAERSSTRSTLRR